MTRTPPTRALGRACPAPLSSVQIDRYQRHLLLPEVGIEGQQKLLDAKVLCIGAGGLGCPVSLYLAAAGVGTISLADADVVSSSNLQRQVLYGQNTIGADKVNAAARRLKDLNPDLKLLEIKTIVNGTNVLDLARDYDVIVDATDNFPTRYCVNDACVILKKPNVYGSIFRFEGMVSVFAPHLPDPQTNQAGPCYRCLYPRPPRAGSVPSCAEGGVLGVICGVIGSLQATEVIKLILGIGRPAIGRLTTYSALDLEFRTVKIRRDPACPVCGNHPTITSPIDYEEFCGMPAIDPQSSAQTTSRSPVKLDKRGLPPGYNFKADWEITPRQVKQMLDSKERLLLIDCRLPSEHAATSIPGARLMPLQQIDQHLSQLLQHKNDKIVVHCKAGSRSLQFAQALRQAGFTDVRSMAGGILLWNADCGK